MQHCIYFIPIFHFQLIRGLLGSQTTAIKQECNRVEFHRLSVAVSVHKLLQLGTSLDPEKHFIPILALDFEVDVGGLIGGLLVLLLVRDA